MKIRPVGAELFHADGRTDERIDKANSHFLAILQTRPVISLRIFVTDL